MTEAGVTVEVIVAVAFSTAGAGVTVSETEVSPGQGRRVTVVADGDVLGAGVRERTDEDVGLPVDQHRAADDVPSTRAAPMPVGVPPAAVTSTAIVDVPVWAGTLLGVAVAVTEEASLTGACDRHRDRDAGAGGRHR